MLPFHTAPATQERPHLQAAYVGSPTCSQIKRISRCSAHLLSSLLTQVQFCRHSVVVLTPTLHTSLILSICYNVPVCQALVGYRVWEVAVLSEHQSTCQTPLCRGKEPQDRSGEMFNLHSQLHWIWNHLGDTPLGVVCDGKTHSKCG